MRVLHAEEGYMPMGETQNQVSLSHGTDWGRILCWILFVLCDFCAVWACCLVVNIACMLPSLCSRRTSKRISSCPLLGSCVLSGCAGDFRQDLVAFDPIQRTVFDPTAKVSGAQPGARQSHGFTSAGGKLFVHGGGDREVGGA